MSSCERQQMDLQLQTVRLLHARALPRVLPPSCTLNTAAVVALPAAADLEHYRLCCHPTTAGLLPLQLMSA